MSNPELKYDHKMMSLSKQQGMAALVVCMTLLTAATTATFVASKNVNLQSRSSNDQYAAQQAFEAAEAGLELATTYVPDNQESLIVDSNSSGFIDQNSTSGTLSGSNATYNFTVSNLQSGNLKLLKVTATGTSSDGKITRTVSQLFNFKPLLKLGSIPPLPVTAKNNISLGGNSQINNNSQELGLWSGGSSIVTGSANINTTGANNTKDNDSNLYSATQNELFKNYFGASMDSIKALSVVHISDGSTIAGSNDTFHWIVPTDGTLQITSNTTIGTVDNPVIIVVEGKLKLAGTVSINGFIFVTGDVDIKGTANIHGAIVSNADLDIKGNANISYDYDILSNAASNIGSYARIPGSWNDY